MNKKSAEEILKKHLKQCYVIHDVKLSDKFHTYLLRAMEEYATQKENDKELPSDDADKVAKDFCKEARVQSGGIVYNAVIYGYYKAQSLPKEQKGWSDENMWTCNSCGSAEYTGSISDEDIKQLSCVKCGGDEFHKEPIVKTNTNQ